MMVWTVAIIHVLLTESVYLVGEYPTQQKCLTDIRNIHEPELKPDIVQCVQVKKEVLYEYRGN